MVDVTEKFFGCDGRAGQYYLDKLAKQEECGLTRDFKYSDLYQYSSRRTRDSLVKACYIYATPKDKSLILDQKRIYCLSWRDIGQKILVKHKMTVRDYDLSGFCTKLSSRLSFKAAKALGDVLYLNLQCVKEYEDRQNV